MTYFPAIPLIVVATCLSNPAGADYNEYTTIIFHNNIIIIRETYTYVHWRYKVISCNGHAVHNLYAVFQWPVTAAAGPPFAGLKIDRLSVANRYVTHHGQCLVRIGIGAAVSDRTWTQVVTSILLLSWLTSRGQCRWSSRWLTCTRILYNNINIYPAGDRTQPACYSGGSEGRRRRSSKIKLSRRMYRDANNRPPPADDLWYYTHTHTHSRVYIFVYILLWAPARVPDLPSGH